MQALVQEHLSLRLPSPRVSAPTARIPAVRAAPVQQCSSSPYEERKSFLALSLSALLALQLGGPILTPPSSQAATNEDIREKTEHRKKMKKTFREQAENFVPEEIPCVNVGCSSDDTEAAVQRKKKAEERKEEIARQARTAYEQQQQRTKKNFNLTAVANKSRNLDEQEALQRRRREIAREAAERANTKASRQQQEEPIKEPLTALQGTGIFGSEQ